MRKKKNKVYYCDCCGKQLKDNQVENHHLIPRLLRNGYKDNKKQVILCHKCHTDFHKLVNFADVIGKSKGYFEIEYYLFKRNKQIIHKE